MEIEIKILDPRAKLPMQGTPQAAGFDLFACIDKPLSIRRGDKAVLVNTGLAIYMAPGLGTLPNHLNLAALVMPRSGLGHKQGLQLGNTLGLIDPDYQNEWFVSAWNRGQQDEIVIEPGERFAQVIFVPVVTPRLKVVPEFSAVTARGLGGFGSTGSHALPSA